MRRRTVVGGALCALGVALALVVGERWVSATGGGCDFLTGGGYIYPIAPATGNKGHFAVAGGCKHGSFWGHLVYRDQSANVQVHSIEITGYQKADETNARLICGTGRTQTGGHVDFVVRAKDAGEPGINDEFDIQLTGALFYSTFFTGPHKLGGGTQGGGNIKLHKPHMNSGDFGGQCPPILSAPPPPPPPPPPIQNVTLIVTIDPLATGTGIVTGPGITCSKPEGTPAPQDCEQSLPEGTEVTLMLQGTDGSTVQFTSPEECQIGTTSPDGTTATCTFMLTEATADVKVSFFAPE